MFWLDFFLVYTSTSQNPTGSSSGVTAVTDTPPSGARAKTISVKTAGAIIGGVAGALVLIIILLVVYIVRMKKCHKRSRTFPPLLRSSVRILTPQNSIYPALQRDLNHSRRSYPGSFSEAEGWQSAYSAVPRRVRVCALRRRTVVCAGDVLVRGCSSDLREQGERSVQHLGAIVERGLCTRRRRQRVEHTFGCGSPGSSNNPCRPWTNPLAGRGVVFGAESASCGRSWAGGGKTG